MKLLLNQSLTHKLPDTLRAAGTIYQAVLREELSTRLGVRWAEVSNGCAEIKGLDNRALIKKFSARMSEIDQWRASGPGTCGDISVARSW